MQQQNENYNGWTNWDTWAAHLWLSNDEYSYRLCRRESGTNNFKKMAWSLLIDIDNPDKLNMTTINWEELEEAFSDD